MNKRTNVTPTTLTLRSSANACQSFLDASFNAEGETNGFIHRTPLPRRSRPNPTDWKCEWTETLKACDSRESPATHAQMPSLRSSLCPPCPSWSASVGNTRSASVPPRLLLARVASLRLGLAVELPSGRVIDAALP